MRAFEFVMSCDDVFEGPVIVEIPVDRQHPSTLDTDVLQRNFTL